MAILRAVTSGVSIYSTYNLHGTKAIPPQNPEDPPTSDWAYAWINGSAYKSSGNVYSSGQLLMGAGDNTLEWDSYVLNPGEMLLSTPHTAASGTILTGSATVFVNGKPVARAGDSVLNHAGSNTSFTDHVNTVYIG